jgi:hypothetical protein
MDEDRHILVILVFFMAISHVRKKKKNHFYHSQTSVKAQQEEKQKMRKDEMKKEKIWSVWFRVYFDQQGGFHENNNIVLQQHWPQGLQIGNWSPNLISILVPWGQARAIKW